MDHCVTRVLLVHAAYPPRYSMPYTFHIFSCAAYDIKTPTFLCQTLIISPSPPLLTCNAFYVVSHRSPTHNPFFKAYPFFCFRHSNAIPYMIKPSLNETLSSLIFRLKFVSHIPLIRFIITYLLVSSFTLLAVDLHYSLFFSCVRCLSVILSCVFLLIFTMANIFNPSITVYYERALYFISAYSGLHSVNISYCPYIVFSHLHSPYPSSSLRSHSTLSVS